MTVGDIHRLFGQEYLKVCQSRESLYISRTETFEAQMEKSIELHRLREQFTRNFGFCIPTYALILKLKQLSPIVEIGAGTGLLSHLVKNAGGQITPYDTQPPRLKKNYYCFSKEFMPVFPGDHRSLKRHPNSTLLLCWPPYRSNMAFKCLAEESWRGKHLVVIGEGYGGCTANDRFFKRLGKDWELIEELNIPQFPGIHDDVCIYRRKQATCKL